jgi:serine/threonine protein kinase
MANYITREAAPRRADSVPLRQMTKGAGSMVLQPGATLGQYQIQEVIGTGGMATVYKAQHTRLNRTVAIKMMHPQYLADEQFQVRFEREAQVIARLDHPNIVTVYDYDEYERQPYLVIRYIEGQTLKHVIRQGALPLPLILRVMNGVASALDYAHQQGVLHRDVKPSNIILSEDLTPYVTDFGLARMAQIGESTLSADVMLGTPQYISPEQARGDQKIDHHTDLYSFAIILYELLVGRVPFSADSAYATIHEQIYVAPPSPSQFNSEITPAVEAVLLKALAKDPQQRYHSARELMHALEDALNASGIHALNPNRAQNAVPVGDTTRDAIPAAVKAPQVTVPREKRLPEVTFEEDPGAYIGQMAGRAAHSFGRAVEEMFADEDEESQAKRSKKRRRSDANLSDVELEEKRIRKQVEKRMEERNGLLIHFAIYVSVNLFLTIASGSPVIPVIFFWGMGMIGHFFSYYYEYGGGRDRREAVIQREIQREREIRYGTKVKNEELVDTDEIRRIRLTGDGELTESFVDEINQVDEARHKRR